jgi:hypothetical protein
VSGIQEEVLHPYPSTRKLQNAARPIPKTHSESSQLGERAALLELRLGLGKGSSLLPRCAAVTEL